ncbi:MAG: patatin family protein, partial [Gammaproteobacteria bacterium]
MSDVRLGLALSGGGFRAAFFHLGVLARMAELDLLRQVESISTVSGGSIIGALYYIHLKNLLETVPDDQINRDHYLQLVTRIEHDFSKAVKRNLRMCTFASVRHNMKMALPHYSRSDRIGELYDEYIFRPAWNKNENDPPRTTPIMMHELKIHPLNDAHESDFNPTRGHNARRKNKVPVLNINASVLNTGHDWRFTAVDMGEVVHEQALDVDIDKNTRLLKGRYNEICKRQQGFLLGKAVAASAGVPGIFPPLSISDMYEMRVQLVDGGVYDNQGIAALLNGGIECTHMIISDASGQMRDDHNPETGTLSVFTRTTDMLMGRVREEMIAEACDKQGASNVRIMHMTQGLPVMFMRHRGVDCKPVTDERTQVGDPIPTYDQDMRGRVARIRTDLDSFHDVEASSIMTLGYALATAKLDAMLHQLVQVKHPHDTVEWP